jgi:hypothetical protein
MFVHRMDLRGQVCCFSSSSHHSLVLTKVCIMYSVNLYSCSTLHIDLTDHELRSVVQSSACWELEYKSIQPGVSHVIVMSSTVVVVMPARLSKVI